MNVRLTLLELASSAKLEGLQPVSLDAELADLLGALAVLVDEADSLDVAGGALAAADEGAELVMAQHLVTRALFDLGGPFVLGGLVFRDFEGKGRGVLSGLLLLGRFVIGTGRPRRPLRTRLHEQQRHDRRDPMLAVSHGVSFRSGTGDEPQKRGLDRGHEPGRSPVTARRKKVFSVTGREREP